jgi:hypothetical protein
MNECLFGCFIRVSIKVYATLLIKVSVNKIKKRVFHEELVYSQLFILIIY